MAPTVVALCLHLRHKATLQDLTEEWQSLQVPFAPQSYRGAARTSIDIASNTGRVTTGARPCDENLCRGSSVVPKLGHRSGRKDF